jgi:hypothetical protein
LSKTTETTEVLVGADVTESTESVVDTGTAFETCEAWSVGNVGLDATKASEALSTTEVGKIAKIASLLVDFTAGVDATNLTEIVEHVGTTSVHTTSAEASTDDGTAGTTEEATSSVIDDSVGDLVTTSDATVTSNTDGSASTESTGEATSATGTKISSASASDSGILLNGSLSSDGTLSSGTRVEECISTGVEATETSLEATTLSFGSRSS